MASSYIESTRERALSVSNVAYEFNYPGRLRNQKLTARTSFNLHRLNKFLDTQFIDVPEVQPTQAELFLNHDYTVGLWVGMRPSTESEPETPRTGDGSSVDQQPGFQVIEYDPNALRVIVPLRSSFPSYYCLADQKDGLCTAFITSMKHVYFFDEEFRDDTATTLEARVNAWNKKTKDACKIQKETLRSKGYRLPMQPRGGLVHDANVDTGVSNAATETDNGVTKKARPAAREQREKLYKLVTPDKTLSLQECKQAIQEIYDFAPDMKQEALEPHEIQSISEGLVQARIVLDFRLLHDFIIVFVERLRSKSTKGKRALVMDARTSAQKMYGWAVGREAISAVGFSDYLAGEIKKLRKIVRSMLSCAATLRTLDTQDLVETLQSRADDVNTHLQRLKELRSTLSAIHATEQESEQPSTELARPQ